MFLYISYKSFACLLHFLGVEGRGRMFIRLCNFRNVNRETVSNWLLLAALGALLGRSWAALWRSWAALGFSWALLRRSWALLVCSWALFGCSWGALGALLGRSWGGSLAPEAQNERDESHRAFQGGGGRGARKCLSASVSRTLGAIPLPHLSL